MPLRKSYLLFVVCTNALQTPFKRVSTQEGGVRGTRLGHWPSLLAWKSIVEGARAWKSTVEQIAHGIARIARITRIARVTQVSQTLPHGAVEC